MTYSRKYRRRVRKARMRLLLSVAAIAVIAGVAGQGLQAAQQGESALTNTSVLPPQTMAPMPLCTTCQPLPAAHNAGHGAHLLGGCIAYRVLCGPPPSPM